MDDKMICDNCGSTLIDYIEDNIENYYSCYDCGKCFVIREKWIFKFCLPGVI